MNVNEFLSLNWQTQCLWSRLAVLHQLFASAKALCLFFFHRRNSKWKTLLCCRAYYDFCRCIQEANGCGPKIRVSLVNGHQRAEIPWRLHFQMFNIKILFGNELFFQQLIMDQKWMFIPLPALLIVHEFIPHPWRWKRRIGIGQLKTFQSFPWWFELFPTRYSKPGFFHLAIKAASSDVATAPESHKKF